jgi:hypothetical protein
MRGQRLGTKGFGRASGDFAALTRNPEPRMARVAHATRLPAARLVYQGNAVDGGIRLDPDRQLA